MRLVGLLAVLVSGHAWACSCGWSGFPAAFASGEVAFEGRAVDLIAPVEHVGLPEQLGGLAYLYVVEVDRVFKGRVAKTVLVTTEMSTCGTYPRLGDRWVFVTSNVGLFSYEMHACDGTTEFASLAPADAALLRSSTPPRARTPELLLTSLATVSMVVLVVRRLRRAKAPRH